MTKTAHPVGTRKNKSGVTFALGRDKATGTFGVYKLCQNYDGTVPGGIRNTWRVVAAKLEYQAARELFDTRTKR